MRRLLRLRLQTLFALTTVVGAWLGVHTKWIHDREQALASLRLKFDQVTTAPLTKPGTPLGLRLLGEAGIAQISLTKVEPRAERFRNSALWTEAREVSQLFPEAIVHLTSQRPVEEQDRFCGTGNSLTTSMRGGLRVYRR